MNIPITSKIKRSPLLSDKTDPNAKKYGSEEGKTTKKEITSGGDRKVEEKADSAEFLKTMEAERKRRGFDGTTQEYIKYKEQQLGYTPKTEVIEEKGKDLNYETDLYKQKKGDVLQPWETRQMSRAIKKEQRDIRRAKQKLAKAKKRGNTIKEEEAQAELAQFQAMADRGSKARATGFKTGTKSVQTGQEKMLKGDLEKDEQLEQAKQEALKKQRAAEESGLTTGSSTFSQADQAITSSSDFAKMADVFSNEEALNYKPFESLNSPLGKTLQGNQYKLPQHLQEKIKAAPGKKRAPLKKGYFNK